MKEKSGIGKYFIAGIIAAIVIFIIFKINDTSSPGQTGQKQNQKKFAWSPETDSQFVKDCYGKYKSQIKDDPKLAENTKTFCRCMLDKIQSKYSEAQMERVSNEDIKKWDTECRNEIKNPMFKQENPVQK